MPGAVNCVLSAVLFACRTGAAQQILKPHFMKGERMKKLSRPYVTVCFCLFWLVVMPWILCKCEVVHAASEPIAAEDGSAWERVSEPGFGNNNNLSVVRMTEYHGFLYAITRNDAEGGELWRFDGAIWQRVSVVGSETNGIYGNPAINNLFAAMAVFQDKLTSGFLPVSGRDIEINGL